MLSRIAGMLKEVRKRIASKYFLWEATRMKTELMRQLLSKDEKITIEFKEC